MKPSAPELHFQNDNVLSESNCKWISLTYLSIEIRNWAAHWSCCFIGSGFLVVNMYVTFEQVQAPLVFFPLTTTNKIFFPLTTTNKIRAAEPPSSMGFNSSGFLKSLFLIEEGFLSVIHKRVLTLCFPICVFHREVGFRISYRSFAPVIGSRGAAKWPNRCNYTEQLG